MVTYFNKKDLFEFGVFLASNYRYAMMTHDDPNQVHNSDYELWIEKKSNPHFSIPAEKPIIGQVFVNTTTGFVGALTPGASELRNDLGVCEEYDPSKAVRIKDALCESGCDVVSINRRYATLGDGRTVSVYYLLEHEVTLKS